MRFMWRNPCDCGNCDTKRTGIEIGSFSVTYFNDYGEWFVYVY